MLPHLWRRTLSASRAVLALICLVLVLFRSGLTVSVLTVVLCAFTVYSLIALFWKSLEDSRHDVPALILDGLFFCFCAWFITGPASWAVSGFFVYLIASAILRQPWHRILFLLLMSIFVLAVFPKLAPALWPAVIFSTLLGAAWLLDKNRLQDRMSGLSRQVVLFRYDAERAREAERQRIAADFHDGPLQSFISFQMRLEIVRKLLARDQNAALSELLLLQELCKGQVNELRSFVRSMRPAEVDGVSLSASLRRVVEQFQKDTTISTAFVSGEFLDPAEPEISIEVLLIVREALNNIQKHSKATRVAISVEKLEEYLEIAIEDNGVGFAFSGSYSLDELELLRLGPVSIKRRVRSLGGEMTLESRPGQGAELKVRTRA